VEPLKKSATHRLQRKLLLLFQVCDWDGDGPKKEKIYQEVWELEN